MKKYLFFIFVFTFIISFFSFGTAKALSPFDTAYQTTDELPLYYDEGPWQCEREDFSSRWTILVDTKITGVTQEYVDSFKRAQDGDGRWTVSSTDVGYTSSISITWTEDNSLSLEWVNFQNSFYYVRATNARTIQFNVSFGNCEVFANQGIGFASVSDSTGQTKNLLTYIDPQNINYPPDYDGDPIRQNFVPLKPFTPDISYTLTREGSLRAQYNQNGDGDLNGTGNWQLYKTDKNYENAVQIDQKLIRPFQDAPYGYKIEDLGFYYIRVTYETTGDQNEAPTGFDYVRSSFLYFEFTGNRLQQGNNSGCQSNDGNCVLPDSGNPFIKLFLSVENTAYGLDAVVTAPLVFIVSLLDAQGTCQPLQLPLPAFMTYDGSSGTLTYIEIPCMETYVRNLANDNPHTSLWYFNAAINTYQTILTALVAYYAFARLLGTVKDIKDPDINRIEIAKL